MLKNKLKNTAFLSTFLYFVVGTLLLILFSIFTLPPGNAIVGHDSGMPLDAGSFLKSRFFAWDERDGFGADNSHLFGSLTIHFVDYLASVVGRAPYAGNWFNLFFWFWAIFTAGIFLAYELKDRLGKYFIFLFPPLLVFNFFIFQAVFILERAKYSVLVATLLFLAISFRILEKKSSILTASIIGTVVITVFNSGSLLGLPLYGGFIICMGILLFLTILLDLKKKNFSSTFRLIKFFLLTFVLCLVVNAYQIFPYIQGIRSSKYTAHLFSSNLGTTLEWVNYISQNTSPLNLFRFQGIPAWYSDTNLINAEHTYASKYLTDPLLVIVSFILPMIAFASLLIAKTIAAKKVIIFFTLLTLISIIFTAGTHPPFGFIYAFLFERMPGFILFRTPYYKFASGLFLGLAALLAYTLSMEIEHYTKKSYAKGIFLAAIMLSGILFYHKALFRPENNFQWKKNFSTKVVPPEYIFEAKNWLEANVVDQRTLVVPPVNQGDFSDGYTWGYWSLSPLTYSLSTASFLSNTSIMSDEERAWTYVFYDLLKQGQHEKMFEIGKRLNVGYILFRGDTQNSEEEVYRKALLSSKNIKEVNNFGKWSIYQIDGGERSHIKVLPDPVVVPPKQEYLSRELLRNFGSGVTMQQPTAAVLPNVFDRLARSQECISCQIERRSSIYRLSGVRVLPNSPLYVLKEAKEDKALQQAIDDKSKINFYLGRSLGKLSEVASMITLSMGDEDMVVSLKKINQYFDSAYQILASNKEKYAGDFYLQKLIHDHLEFIGNYLGRYSEIENFYARSGKVRDEILGVLWNIRKIRNLYPSTLVDFDQWNYKKIYNVMFETDGDYKLYFLPSSFHQSSNNTFIPPTSVELTNQGRTENIEISENTKTVDKWLEVDIGNRKTGTESLTMHFDNFPNVFEEKGPSLEEFPNGKKGCFIGHIKNFSSGKKYLVKLSLGEGNTDMTMLFRDPKRTYSASNEFIQGEERVDIGEDVNAFKYIYYPLTNPSDINIYVCKQNESFPSVKEIVVNEIFEPFVVSVAQKDTGIAQLPSIKYTKINPTKYQIQVENAKDSFILTSANRFDANWTLSKVGTDTNLFQKIMLIANTVWGTPNKDEQQVLVDGFANGWIVNEKGNYELVLEYSSQVSFYVGIVVSILGVMLLVILAIRQARLPKSL